MKSFLVALFFVGFASAQLGNENFLQRHKRDNGPSEKNRPAEACLSGASGCCDDPAKCTTQCSSLIVDESEYSDFVKYTNDHLIRSYEYLFLSAQFGTYLKDRPGFEKVLHTLADGAWNKGIEMIKETTKRGAAHNFDKTNCEQVTASGELGEVAALARAVEIEKDLLITAYDIHRHHSHATLKDDNAKGYEVGIAHYLEEEIIEDKTETVRTLVGHVNDLKNIFKTDFKLFPMSLYLFDQYLQK